ncbi:MAG: MarR family transcriptional regulator [Actinomycetia bacterium]|nr:MarR family transcriptional regulator [Actinomycetes bacterium]
MADERAGPDPAARAAAADVQVNLALVIRHARLPRLHRRVLANAGVFLDRSSYAVLVTVDGLGQVRLSDLAAEMMLDLSTVSRQVRRLEDAGLLERSVDPEDKRVSVVRPSAAGRVAANQLNHAWQDAFGEALANWPEPELREFASQLARLSEALRGIAEQQPS